MKLTKKELEIIKYHAEEVAKKINNKLEKYMEINEKKIREIEREIYSVEYDSLSDYGKGIRDLFNYIGEREDISKGDIIEFIKIERIYKR
jgi:hypothetical protein